MISTFRTRGFQGIDMFVSIRFAHNLDADSALTLPGGDGGYFSWPFVRQSPLAFNMTKDFCSEWLRLYGEHTDSFDLLAPDVTSYISPVPKGEPMLGTR